MKKSLFASVLAAGLLFAGVGFAQNFELPAPGLLPDNPFYFLKRITEGIGSALTFGEVRRVERAASLAETRLAEARALVDKGKDELAARALGRYEERIQSALGLAEAAREKGLDIQDVAEKVSEATLRHQGVLAEVYERVPDEAKGAILRAMEVSRRGHEEALQALSGERLEQIRPRLDEVRQRLQELPIQIPVEIPVEIPIPASPLPGAPGAEAPGVPVMPGTPEIPAPEAPSPVQPETSPIPIPAAPIVPAPGGPAR